MFEKYLYALGKGVRSVRRTLDEEARKEAVADPNAPRDVTPDDTSVAEPAATVDVSSVVPARTPLRLSHRALVMGIVNVTPDSFSDGGRYLDHAAAVAHGEQLAAEGADILDIGGESTRPGAATVTLDEEIARVVPVVQSLSARTRLPISIDTMKAKVAAAAIEAGATIVNDVWGFQFDPDIARVSAEAQVHCVLMHNRRQDDAGIDMFAEVKDFLSRSIDIALKAGVNRDKIFIDPGIGFGKTHDQSFELVRRLAHWLMKEPDLEEESLRAQVIGGRLTIERRSLSPAVPPVTVTAMRRPLVGRRPPAPAPETPLLALARVTTHRLVTAPRPAPGKPRRVLAMATNPSETAMASHRWVRTTGIRRGQATS